MNVFRINRRHLVTKPRDKRDVRYIIYPSTCAHRSRHVIAAHVFHRNDPRSREEGSNEGGKKEGRKVGRRRRVTDLLDTIVNGVIDCVSVRLRRGRLSMATLRVRGETQSGLFFDGRRQNDAGSTPVYSIYPTVHHDRSLAKNHLLPEIRINSFSQLNGRSNLSFHVFHSIDRDRTSFRLHWKFGKGGWAGRSRSRECVDTCFG